MNAYTLESNTDDIIAAQTKEDALQWFIDHTYGDEKAKLTLDSLNKVDDEIHCWGNVKHYTKEYIEDNGIILDFKNKSPELDDITVIEGVLMQRMTLRDMLNQLTTTKATLLLTSV